MSPVDDNLGCNDILLVMSRIIILLVVISVFRMPISSLGCSLTHQDAHLVDPCELDVFLHNSNSIHHHLTDIVDSFSSVIYSIFSSFVCLVSFKLLNNCHGITISPPTPPPKYA